MESRNCPNCGAPNEPYLNKCPYCGTSYFDLTAIDIADGKPMFLKIRVGDRIITQLVYPDPDISVECNVESQDIEIPNGLFTRIYTNISCTTDIRFHSIPDGHNRIYTIEEGERKWVQVDPRNV